MLKVDFTSKLKNDFKAKPNCFGHEIDETGAVEPNAQGCAFAHPILHPQARKGQILRTQILTSIKLLHTQF